MNIRSTLIVLSLSLVPSLALAQSSVPQSAAPAAPAVEAAKPAATGATGQPRSEASIKFREACAADVQKFCSTVERGKDKDGRNQMRACLDSHAKDLTDTCKAARAEREAQSKTKS